MFHLLGQPRLAKGNLPLPRKILRFTVSRRSGLGLAAIASSGEEDEARFIGGQVELDASAGQEPPQSHR